MLALRNTSSMASAADQYSRSRPKPVRSSSSFPTLIFELQESATAWETTHSGRCTQEGYGGKCFDTLDLGGEVRGCSVGGILGMPEISPSVFIAAASRYMGFLELNKCFFKRGCFECGGISRFFNFGQARSWVRVRSCRMWFQFDELFIS